MHLDHEHVNGLPHDHEHTHEHSHEHTHADGTTHSHEHMHAHHHDHEHPHAHEHLHDHDAAHEHSHEDCSHDFGTCGSHCEHTPMEELMALMKYMVGHNAAHAKELADLAVQLDKAGNHTAFEQVMAAVSDFEKGNMRLSVVLASMDVK